MPAATLARLVVLEARRGGLPWLALAAVLAAAVLAAFLSQVAITESREVQLSVVAPLLRACAVLLVVLHVASSTARQISDRTLELTLALPLSRAAQYLGRLGGHAACAALIAAALALPLLALAAPGRLALWTLSLALEGALVAAAALFFATSLAQLVPAIATSIALYLLARIMPAIQSLANIDLPEPSLAAQAAELVVDGVALLLPRLDAVTRTDWLLYGAPSAGAFASALAGVLLYGLLLTAAGLFDFYRKEL
jgi:hypothetical protein